MQTLKRRFLVLLTIGALAVPAGALGATARESRPAVGPDPRITTIPATYVRVLAAAFAGLPQGEAQLLISAVARAPFSSQGAIVSQLARLSPAAVQTMDAVLATAFQGMTSSQAQSFADTIVGVGSAGEQQLVAATASAVLARSAGQLPSPLQSVVVSVFRRVPPAVQLVALAANRIAIAQTAPGIVQWYIGTLNQLVAWMEPSYDVYAQSLVAVAVGLETPTDVQRYRELLAYMQAQIQVNNLVSGLAADIHASNQYEGERWACVLGGNWLADVPGGAICY